MKIFSKLLILIIWFVFSCLGLLLLLHDHFTGSEFNAFFFGSSLLCLAVGFGTRLKEFNILGNTLKLNDAVEDAEKLIKELKEAKLASYRVSLSQLKIIISGADKDSRNLEGFWLLHDIILQNGLYDEVLPDIHETARAIAYHIQLDLRRYKPEINNPFEDGKLVPLNELVTLKANINTAQLVSDYEKLYLVVEK